jgi:hypothetical protein
MKKLFFCFFPVLGAILLLGCATVAYAPHDPKTPVKERCLLEFAEYVGASKMDGNGVIWFNLVTIPAGSHTLELNFNKDIYTRGSALTREDRSRTTEWTSWSVSSISIEYDFEAGHHYIVDIKFTNSEGKPMSLEEATLAKRLGANVEVYVNYDIIDKGTRTSRFNNGTYSQIKSFFGFSLGTTSLSHLSTGLDFGARYLCDSFIHWNTYLGLELNFSWIPGIDPIDLRSYLMADFYMPGSNVNLGLGGGYIAQYFDYTNIEFYPYTRGELGFGDLKLYFDYFFNQDMIDGYKWSEPSFLGNFGTPRRWGLGIIARM